MKYTNIIVSILLISLMAGMSMASVPDTPGNLTNTTGNGWVRWAWDAGTGASDNATDSYNISIAYGGATTWANASVDGYKKVSGVSGESVTISVYGYNVTHGQLSTVATDTVTVPQMFASIVNLIDAFVPVFRSLLDLIVAFFPLVIASIFLCSLAVLIGRIFDGTLDVGKFGKKKW
jgi:hypothetical protein